MSNQIDVSIASHFRDFIIDWSHRHYIAVGGYGSGKSFHIGDKIVLKLLQEPNRKCLVVRKVYSTLLDSTFALLQDIISGMNLPKDVVKIVKSPLGIKFSNGSEIIFKGLDDKEKLKSIHNVSIIWLEEASEFDYADYKELLGRARHPYHSIHFIISTNPVNKQNWVYKHYFINSDNLEDVKITLDDEDLYDERVIKLDNKYYHHSTATDNPFLPESYVEQLDEIQEYDPDLYRIARKGQFGTIGTKVLPQLEVWSHEDVMRYRNRWDILRTGMDFGFETSYNALTDLGIIHDKGYLFIYDEFYKRKMTDIETANDEDFKRFKAKLIRADCAEPKTIKFYNQMGYRMKGAEKPTKIEGIKKIKRFKKIIVSSKCRNTVRELKDLTFKEDKNGNIIEDEFNIDSHTFDSIKYGLEGYEVSNLKGDTVRTISRRRLLGY